MRRSQLDVAAWPGWPAPWPVSLARTFSNEASRPRSSAPPLRACGPSLGGALAWPGRLKQRQLSSRSVLTSCWSPERRNRCPTASCCERRYWPQPELQLAAGVATVDSGMRMSDLWCADCESLGTQLRMGNCLSKSIMVRVLEYTNAPVWSTLTMLLELEQQEREAFWCCHGGCEWSLRLQRMPSWLSAT